MHRLLRVALVGLLIGGNIVTAVHGFTLRGPSMPWMTAANGYDNLLYGPMGLGEEYRGNVPTLYYAFSPEFLNYFGQTGVDEIEKIIGILNDLPNVDLINPDDYPLAAMRTNFRAQTLGLLDLKSSALSLTLGTMGLEAPELWVFTLRNRWLVQGGPVAIPNHNVTKRNFDPVTWEPTSFINGRLWTYTIIDSPTATPGGFIVPSTVDPLALGGLINATVASGVPVGSFWTGLTRDDVGGLKYIYRSDNRNVENTPDGATAAGIGAVTSGNTGGSPWGLPSPIATNATGGVPVVAGNIVTTALRPGIGKTTFVRVSYSGGGFGAFISNNVAYADRYISNNVVRTQNVSRQLAIPDIIFDAADLQEDTDGPGPGGVPFFSITFNAWIDNSSTNGVVRDDRVVDTGDYGPGVIPPAAGIASRLIVFNSAAPVFGNVWPFNLTEASNTQLLTWGAFDGTTNEPTVFPSGLSIKAIEQAVFGPGGIGSGGSGLSPWGLPAAITTNTVAVGGAGGTP